MKFREALVKFIRGDRRCVLVDDRHQAVVADDRKSVAFGEGIGPAEVRGDDLLAGTVDIAEMNPIESPVDGGHKESKAIAEIPRTDIF